jgi:sugar phosphate isomerase/epimerase
MAWAARLARIGLQMRTLGDAGADVGAALQMVSAQGYREVEVWTPDGAVTDVARIRAALDRAGLTAPSRQIRMTDLFTNARRILAECQMLGNRHVVCAEVPQEQRQSLAGYARVAPLLNAAGKLTASVSIQLSVHPHRDDFTPRNGVIPYEYLLRNTDPGLVKMQMDVALMSQVNRNPAAELAENPGRFPTLHVNDIERAPGQMPVTLGEGRIDLPGVMAAANRAGVQHYFVGDERPGAPWDRLKADFAYLSRLEF